MELFRGERHPFSHFFRTEICINGLPFNCAEQAYQYFKSRCVQDFDASVSIMRSDNPLHQKRLGSRVAIPLHRWDCVKEFIMLRIDFEKVIHIKLFSTKTSLFAIVSCSFPKIRLCNINWWPPMAAALKKMLMMNIGVSENSETEQTKQERF